MVALAVDGDEATHDGPAPRRALPELLVTDKATVLAALERALRADLAALQAVTASARDEATSAESRPENKYDTRALEASYLAAGQGERLADLSRLVAWMAQQDAAPRARAEEGALVAVRVDDRLRWILLAPRGGPEATVDGVTVQLVSVAAPLGRALLGLREGDVVELDRPRGVQEVEVEVVR